MRVHVGVTTPNSNRRLFVPGRPDQKGGDEEEKEKEEERIKTRNPLKSPFVSSVEEVHRSEEARGSLLGPIEWAKNSEVTPPPLTRSLPVTHLEWGN